jgi:hypothetical protein
MALCRFKLGYGLKKCNLYCDASYSAHPKNSQKKDKIKNEQ